MVFVAESLTKGLQTSIAKKESARSWTSISTLAGRRPPRLVSCQPRQSVQVALRCLLSAVAKGLADLPLARKAGASITIRIFHFAWSLARILALQIRSCRFMQQ